FHVTGVQTCALPISGVLGFEALSRGAREVLFVERSPVAVRALERAAAALGATGARIHAGDARELLQGGGPGTYDVAFLDPPFDQIGRASCRERERRR